MEIKPFDGSSKAPKLTAYVKMSSLEVKCARYEDPGESFQDISGVEILVSSVAQWAPLFPFCGEGFPCTLNQPKQDVLFPPWKSTWNLSFEMFSGLRDQGGKDSRKPMALVFCAETLSKALRTAPGAISGSLWWEEFRSC